MGPKYLVLTTVSSPTSAVRALAARADEWPLLVVGDEKGPVDWPPDIGEFLSIARQRNLKWRLASDLPENHYCRKNLGYLEAMARGASVIAETDDDNVPGSWPPPVPIPKVSGRMVKKDGWINIYPFFTSEHIWPRGYPLEEILASSNGIEVTTGTWSCPVQQYLAEGDPDVDAIYRLTVGKDDHKFDRGASIVLERGAMTPFNSQCTIWFTEAFELMYLPSFVSFRMTDIWRSIVAQVCMWAAGYRLAYHGDGVRQQRNPHNLMRDFADELIGYQRSAEIAAALRALPLTSNRKAIGDNLFACYVELERIGVTESRELPLVEAWLGDVSRARAK